MKVSKITMIISLGILLCVGLLNSEITPLAKVSWVGSLVFSAVLILTTLAITKTREKSLIPVRAQ